MGDGVECCALRVLVSDNSAVSENVDFEVPRPTYLSYTVGTLWTKL